MGLLGKTSLTDREREVIALVGEGLTATAIGAKLGISDRTVELHRYKAMKFLSAKSAAHMVALQKNEIINELHRRIECLEKQLGK